MATSRTADDAFLFLPDEGYLLVDSDGTVQFVNRFACERLDVDPSEVVGAPLSEWWPELAEIAPTSPRHGGALDLTTRWHGNEIGVRFFATDSGLGVALPHGARPTPSSELWAFSRAIRVIAEPVVITTAEPFGPPGPVIVYVNEALLSLTGYDRDEVLGRSPRMFQGPHTDPGELARFHEAFSRWGQLDVTLSNQAKNGTPYGVEIKMVPISDEKGWFTNWVAVQRDVTEESNERVRRESERALVQSILDSLPAQTVMLNLEGDIVAVNGSWTRFWGGSESDAEPEWVGMNYIKVCRRAADSGMPDADGAGNVADGIEAVARGESDTFSYDYQLAHSGRDAWFHLQAVPVTGALGIVVTHTDITRRKNLENELGHRSTHDALTGLANRELLRTHLNEHLAGVRGAAWSLAVAFLDLDNFKDINDGLGHHSGDQLLTLLAERFESAVGTSGTASRLGGDEFVLVAPLDMGERALDSFMSAVRDAVDQPVVLDLATVRVSASVGLVTVPPHGGDATELLRDADTAMYVSKRSGGDRWTTFTPAMQEEVRVRLDAHERLEQALSDDEFDLVFQPVIDLTSGFTVGSEALLRWNHPEQGVLAPGSFLRHVDSGPLMEQIGEWVIDRALSVQTKWLAAEGHELHVMSINISARQLGRGTLPRIVREALDRWSVAPRTLGLELVEGTLLAAGPVPLAEIEEIKAMGVNIALDDFGIGYSSMSCLHQFDVDAIKIDRLFATGVDTSRLDGLLRVLSDLGRAVNAVTIAEGIETVEQLTAMQRANISLGQGYLLGRPAPAGDQPARSLITF